MDTLYTNLSTDVTKFFSEPNAYRSILILIAAIALAYIASKFLARGIIAIAQRVALHSESITDDNKAIRLRQVETYLSVTVAFVRLAVVIVAAYVVWRILSPVSSSGVAAIGAGAFFVVFAGQTLGTLLRDITAGVIMITEQWFNVGDYIKIEPFADVSGVVERFTLRSTRIRSLSGEMIWIHNQQIQAVHVTPNGMRTYEVDIFARNAEKGKAALEEIIATLPATASLTKKPVRIKSVEAWGDGMCHITVTAQVAPGREWLIEKYFVNAIEEVDEGKTSKADRVFVYDPIARFADPVAERKFKRAIRAGRSSTSR